jgi:AcrR family transcriptional regulator
MSRARAIGDRRTHRDALLEAAKKLLRDSSREEISARDLVAASGTNLGSIGYHFGGKDALLDEAARLVFEDWAEAVTAGFRHGSDMTEAESLAQSLERILDDFDALRPSYIGFLGLAARSSRSSDVRDELATHYSRQRERVGRMICERLGPEADAADANRLATLLMAISDGLMLQLMIDPASMPSSSELTAACSRAFATIARASRDDTKRTADKAAGSVTRTKRRRRSA